mgnify:CR=1 FL=1
MLQNHLDGTHIALRHPDASAHVTIQSIVFSSTYMLAALTCSDASIAALDLTDTAATACPARICSDQPATVSFENDGSDLQVTYSQWNPPEASVTTCPTLNLIP